MSPTSPDTITALATPDGEGAISVIRISGPLSLSILKSIFRLRKKGTGEMEPLRLYRGWIHDGDRDIDDLMVAVMEVPRSYTGEDMVEIYSHGGRVISSLILDLITSRGARMAEPGEFTRRAFLNGKMDLTRAESVAWLISARSEEELRSAVGQLGGGLRDRLLKIKGDLIHALSLVEITLDFDEHEDHPVPYPEVRALIISARRALKSIWSEARAGGFLHDGIRVVIVSRENPLPFLARARANRTMGVLGRDGLRLSDEEARGIAGLQTGGALTEVEIRRICDSADGWAAGVILLSEIIGGQASFVPCLPAEVPEEVFDYFAAEVFAGLDETRRDFLRRTAFVKDITPHLAERLTGRNDAGSMLARLHEIGRASCRERV